jgi:hypothetical protein
MRLGRQDRAPTCVPTNTPHARPLLLAATTCAAHGHRHKRRGLESESVSVLPCLFSPKSRSDGMDYAERAMESRRGRYVIFSFVEMSLMNYTVFTEFNATDYLY